MRLYVNKRERLNYMITSEYGREVAKETLKAVQKSIDKKGKYDKTFKSRIINQISPNTYQILHKGHVYDAKCDIELSNGQMVNVRVPQNDFCELYIESVINSPTNTSERSFDKTYKGIITAADNETHEYTVSINGTQRKIKSEFFFYVGSDVIVRAIQGDFSNLYLEMNQDNATFLSQVLLDSFKKANEISNKNSMYEYWSGLMRYKFMEYKGFANEDEYWLYIMNHEDEWNSYLQDHQTEFEEFYQKYKDVNDPIDYPQRLD